MTIPHPDGFYEVLWPRAVRRSGRRPLAPRLPTLAGKRIGLLWDYLFRGDEIFAILETGLRSRYPDIQFVGWREFGNIHGSDERQVVAALPEKLKSLGIDAVVAAVGA